MFEAIKNLSPAHRFQAFLVVVILSTLTSIATAYMSTDDCSGLAGQYNVLIKNYTETLSLNNQLVSDNNQKQKDFMLIKKMLDSLDGLEPEIVKTTTMSSKTEPKVIKQHHSIVTNDTIVVAAYRPEVVETHKTKTINTETTITKMSDKHKKLLGSVYNVINKHQKQ
jgi:hypothetical protein